MSIAGRDTTVKHGTHGALSSLTNFTTKTMDLKLSFDGEEVDMTVFGDGFRSFEKSFNNATMDVTYKFDDTILGQLAAIYSAGDVVDFEIGPTGTTAGKAKITGSMILKKFDLPNSVGEGQKVPANWRITGLVTFGSFS